MGSTRSAPTASCRRCSGAPQPPAGCGPQPGIRSRSASRRTTARRWCLSPRRSARASSWAPRTARCTPSTPRPARWCGRAPPATRPEAGSSCPAPRACRRLPPLLVKSFGGLNDLVLVGTATAVGDTTYFALDPATGATLDSYGPRDATARPDRQRLRHVGRRLRGQQGLLRHRRARPHALGPRSGAERRAGAEALASGLEPQAARRRGRDDRLARRAQRPPLCRRRLRRRSPRSTRCAIS